MPADHYLIPRRNAPKIAIPPLSKVAFLFDRVHCHYDHNHKSVLLMIVDPYPYKVAHMVEELLSVF